MKIFCDRHHEALTKSLQMLLVNRLGHELLFPAGLEWFENGYWKIAEPYNNSPVTINQYLGLNNPGIKLDWFLKTPPDVLIASFYNNIVPYKELAQEVGAKLVVQIGNEWPIDWSLVDNLMASTMPINVPEGKNAVFYHQEFDTNIYSYKAPTKDTKMIVSFVNCLSSQKHFKKDWQDFLQLERELDGYRFLAHGASTRDGVINGAQAVAEVMKRSKFGIHLKAGGDGYGHVIHSWMAVGRPVIYRGSQYRGRLASRLLKHQKTGFDIEKADVAKRISKLNWDEYLEMCNNCADAFKREVDFERDAANIEMFLAKLL